MKKEERKFVTDYVEEVIQKSLILAENRYASPQARKRTAYISDRITGGETKPFLTHKSSLMVFKSRLLTNGKAENASISLKNHQENSRPSKFLYYERGAGVFTNKRGQKVNASGKPLTANGFPTAAGSVFDMNTLCISSVGLSRRQSRLKKSETETEDCKSRRQIAQAATEDIHKEEHRFINKEVFTAWTESGRTQACKQGTCASGGISWTNDKIKKRKSASDDQPDECKSDRPKTNACTENNRYNIVQDGNRKRIMMPITVVTATKLQTKGAGNNDSTTSHDDKFRKWKTLNPYIPPENFNFVKSLSTQGVIVRRPVRGFRRDSLKPPTKTNRKTSAANTSGRVEDVPSKAERDRWATKRVPLAYHEPLQLMRHDSETEEIHEMMMKATGKGGQENRSNREPVSMRTVTMPRKGRIKLTALPYELENPEYFDNRKEAAERRDFMERYHQQLLGPALPATSTEGSLIRNKSILKQVKSDVKRLEQDKEYEQTRLLIEADVIPSLVGDLLDYEMSEVPSINTNLQNFVQVQGNPSNNNNNSFPTTNRNPSHHYNKETEVCPPDSARSLPEVSSNSKSYGATATKTTSSPHHQHFNEVIRKMELSNNGRNLGTTVQHPSSRGLWQMSEADMIITPREDAIPYSTIKEHYYPDQDLSLHSILQHAQRMACSRLTDSTKSITFPVIDINNTQKSNGY